MWLYGGVLAIVACGVLFAALSQPGGTAEARDIVAPPSNVLADTTPASMKNAKFGKISNISGSIRFSTANLKTATDLKADPDLKALPSMKGEARGDWQYLKDGTVKVDCTRFEVEAFDAAGKSVATGPAAASREPGTCTYDLRVHADETLASIEITQAPGGAMVLRQSDDESPKEIKGLKATGVKTEWKNVGVEFKDARARQKFDFTSTKTVPLTFDLVE